MKVIKEAWLLQEEASGMFKCTQNTTTPKLYVSDVSANREIKYQENHQLGKYKAVKAFLVIEGDEHE
jgi:hypothetical protein